MLRVAMIGAGWVTRHHLPGWQALVPDVRIVGIADPSQLAREGRAAEFAIDATFADAETMLDTVKPDAVDICSPRDFHAAHVRAAAARGIPALCQKPLAPDYAQAEQLVRDVDGQTRLMVHENWRFRPYYRHARELLQQGEVGNVRQVRMVLESSGLLPDPKGRMPGLDRQPFIATLDRMLVSEILIHHLDTLRFLQGPLRMVAANLGRSTEAIRGEDRATLVMRGSSGASVLLIGDMAVHGAPPVLIDRLQVAGEKATLALWEGTVTLARGGAAPLSQSFDLARCYQQSYNSAIAHFVAALRSDSPFESSPRDNLETLRLVEDAYAATAAQGTA